MQEYLTTLLTVIGALVVLTNLLVQVLKQIIPDEKFSTNYLAVIVAVVLTLVAFFVWADICAITIKWYFVVGAVICGFLVAYAAMFGYDKLYEALHPHER